MFKPTAGDAKGLRRWASFHSWTSIVRNMSFSNRILIELLTWSDSGWAQDCTSSEHKLHKLHKHYPYERPCSTKRCQQPLKHEERNVFRTDLTGSRLPVLTGGDDIAAVTNVAKFAVRKLSTKISTADIGTMYLSIDHLMDLLMGITLKGEVGALGPGQSRSDSSGSRCEAMAGEMLRGLASGIVGLLALVQQAGRIPLVGWTVLMILLCCSLDFLFAGHVR